MSGDGPIPKRSAERRRRNKVATDTTAPATALTVEVPNADPSWHPLAVGWYESLKISGQSQFYEPSDWAAAQVAAWYITELVRKPSSVAFSAAWSAMGALLTTEGERRRVRLEIERAKPVETVPEGVSDIAAWRSKAGNG
jgi:hypothetical protein